MNSDLERGTVGERDGRDDITYGECWWGWLIGETKNWILESWWFYVYNLTHFVERFGNFLRTMSDKDLSGVCMKTSNHNGLLAEHAFDPQSNSTLLLYSLHSIWRHLDRLHTDHRRLVSCRFDNLLRCCN